MGNYDNLPDFEMFPDGDTAIPDVNVTVLRECEGVLFSQDGDDLHMINIDMFIGPTPQDGCFRCCADAQSARMIATHLIKLANYAELGVEAPRDVK